MSPDNMIDEMKLAEYEKDYPFEQWGGSNISECLETIKTLWKVARAAENFVDEIPCYSQGMSLIAEEDVRGEYAQLLEALSALKDKQ